MTNIHQDMQQFLLTDLGVSLANISAHLTWAAASQRQDGSVPFSPEDAARIARLLEAIQHRASRLADALHAESLDPAGLARAIHDITHRIAVKDYVTPMALTSS
jgi:hypothetical protein